MRIRAERNNLTDINGIIIIMSRKLGCFPIFRSNYENNLDQYIGPRESPKFSRLNELFDMMIFLTDPLCLLKI